MATAVANPPKSFISAEEWEEKKVRSDDYAIAWGREEVPDLDAACLLYTSPSPRDGLLSRMPSSA